MASVAPEATNAAFGPEQTVEKTAQPLYVAGYRIPTDNVKWFLAANIAFVVILVVITVILMPLGIPFLAVKKADGLFTYGTVFFAYMFGYFVFFMLMVAALGVGGYAVQQKYFPA